MRLYRDTEIERMYRDSLTVSHRLCFDALAAYEYAIAAIQIFNNPSAAGILEDSRVNARNVEVIEGNIATRTAPQNHPLGFKQDFFGSRGARDHELGSCHGVFL
jgi:hypothetical protein